MNKSNIYKIKNEYMILYWEHTRLTSRVVTIQYLKMNVSLNIKTKRTIFLE